MSIRNDDKKRAKEKKARPDAMHRAVRFLLEQATMNNRDIKAEADYHLEVLDAELGNSKELDAAKKPKPEMVKTAPPETADEDTSKEPAPDTAAVLRQSSRFSRRG